MPVMFYIGLSVIQTNATLRTPFNPLHEGYALCSFFFGYFPFKKK